MQTGQDGEDRLFALLDFLVEHIVGLVQMGEARGAVDYGDGIDMIKLVFAIINHGTQLLGGTCG